LLEIQISGLKYDKSTKMYNLDSILCINDNTEKCNNKEGPGKQIPWVILGHILY